MTDVEELAKRHFIKVNGLGPGSAGRNGFVRIVVAPSWARSRAGQLLTACLVNLLCRQVKLVRVVEVVALDAFSLARMPNGGASGRFPEYLKDIGIWAVNGLVEVSVTPSDTAAEFTVYVGEAPKEPVAGHVLFAIGDGWRAWVGQPARAPSDLEPVSGCPIGPFLAAALAAGEIFKASFGLKRGRYLTGEGYSLWSGLSSEDWHQLAPGPETAGVILPPAHLFGGGAVGNAVTCIAANLELGGGYFILVDNDVYDLTNLNRCLAAGYADFEKPKVDALGRILEGAGLGHWDFPGTIKQYVADGRPGLRPDVAKAVDNLSYEIVLSCVDKAAARQDIQGLEPGLLLGGSTLDLQAKGNVYNATARSICLGCFHQPEADGEKIRAFERQLRSMSPHARREFLAEKDLDAVAIQAHLDGVPCGGLGESAVRDFATRVEPEFSAGFVSLGAGLLLTATLLRKTVFRREAPAQSDMLTLNFLKGGLLDAALGVDPNCSRHASAA